MTIKIPNTVFDGLVRWMAGGLWPEHFQTVIDEHLHAYCDRHDIDSFEELTDKIGGHWVTTLNDIALNDFLGRETEDGNVVDLYLKRRGWKEKAIAKAYMQGIRDSVTSLYEVSDIRPGESFFARDLILGGEPVRVEERAGTQSMAPWEHFALRIVEVRGHSILAGGLLPFDPEMSAQLIEEIHELADRAEIGVEEMFEAGDEFPEPEVIQELALVTVLRMCAPMISETWLMGTMLDPADAPAPQLFNSDGDEIEFFKLHCRFKKGATQAKIRAVLNAAEDMAPASDKIWNWVDRAGRPSAAVSPGKRGSGQLIKSELDDGSVVLGMVFLKGRVLEAETNSVRRAKRLESRLNALIGDLAGPPLIVRQTLAQVMAEQEKKSSPSAPVDIPPEEEARLVKDLYDRHYRDTLDQPVGMLDDKTPRQASRTAAGRRQVAAWLKYLETGEARTRRDKHAAPYDFTWMWDELGVLNLRK